MVQRGNWNLRHAPTGDERFAIRPATRRDRDCIVSLLCAAFANDPVHCWRIPDFRRRLALSPAYFGGVTDAVLHHGEILITSDNVGVRLFIPPVCRDGFDTALASTVAEYADRVELLARLKDANRPTVPHYYLRLSAVAPHLQGGGRGAALLRTVLRKADAESVGCYVECTTVRSQRLMLTHGFAAAPEVVLPGGVVLYPAWREPQR